MWSVAGDNRRTPASRCWRTTGWRTSSCRAATRRRGTDAVLGRVPAQLAISGPWHWQDLSANYATPTSVDSPSPLLHYDTSGGVAFTSVCTIDSSDNDLQETYLSNVGFLSLIHISEPTRLGMISYAVFCLKKKKK